MRLVDYLMSKPLYLGVRVEIANRFAVKDLQKKYNSAHDETQIFDLHKDGKITVEKKDSMLIARGAKSDKPSSTGGLVNFSVMAEVNKDEEVRRIVQIVNVLGNDRLIRERVALFVNGKSLLNAIPELNQLKDAFISIESMMPGFIKSGWYYAPEAIFA